MASTKAKGSDRKFYFPEGALLNTTEVVVVESERRKSDILKEPYVVYLVETRPVEPSLGGTTESALWRRYSEFELLRNYLMAVYPYIVMPPLPEKRINVAKLNLATDKFDPDFIERRRQGLECFLLRLASHPIISADNIFLGFLNQDEGWKESVNATQFQSKVDSRLKSFSAAMNLKKPDKRFEDIRSYGDSLGTNLGAILKIHARIAARSRNIYRFHGEYGRVFSEWSGLEKEMGDGLQKGGHQMDRLSSQAEVLADEEDSTYIDQMKEYLFFTESVKALVRKQQLRQYDLERAEELLSSRVAQRDDMFKQVQLASGTECESPPPQATGFSLKNVSAMLFGAETLEAKEAKLQQFETHVAESEESVKAAEHDVQELISLSLADYDRFQKQKVRDLADVTESYIQLQIKTCKLGLSSWQALRENFASL